MPRSFVGLQRLYIEANELAV